MNNIKVKPRAMIVFNQASNKWHVVIGSEILGIYDGYEMAVYKTKYINAMYSLIEKGL